MKKERKKESNGVSSRSETRAVMFFPRVRPLVSSSFNVRHFSQVEKKGESLFARIRSALNHYWNGSKLLYRHAQHVRQIKKKDPQHFTRGEKLALEQFSYDIKVGVPFVTLFALPIIGYTAPLLALLAPRYLPSTLILPSQKVFAHLSFFFP